MNRQADDPRSTTDATIPSSNPKAPPMNTQLANSLRVYYQAHQAEIDALIASHHSEDGWDCEAFCANANGLGIP
jgi:hypothetical protein